MIVCIAEKPSVAREIAQVLGANRPMDGFMEGNGYQVTWTFGHLCELKEHYQRGGLGDMKCKKLLNAVLNDRLEPMRQRRKELQQDIPEVYNILKKGTEQAREVAARTMDEVRHAMRIDYFNDAELIREQSERFRNK